MYILGYLYSLDNPNFKQNVRGEILSKIDFSIII